MPSPVIAPPPVNPAANIPGLRTLDVLSTTAVSAPRIFGAVEFLSGDYTLVASDRYLQVKATGITIHLAALSNYLDNEQITIQDMTGAITSTPVTIVPNGSDHLNGVNANLTFNTDFATLVLHKTATGWWSQLVPMDGVDSLPTYTFSTLPTPDGSTRLAKISDFNRGLWQSNGTHWFPMGGSVVFNPLDFGADPTGVGDSSTAFNSIMAAMSAVTFDAVGYRIQIPPGVYKLNSTFNITRRVIMTGDQPISNATPAVVLKPAVGVTAIIIHQPNDDGMGNGAGSGTQIRDLTIIGTQAPNWSANTPITMGSYVQPTAGSQYIMKATSVSGDTHTGSVEPTWPSTQMEWLGGAVGTTVVDHNVTWTVEYQAGILIQGSSHLYAIAVSTISGDGIGVIADTSGSPPTNANGTTVERAFIAGVNGSGLYIRGGDTNAGEYQAVDVEGYGVVGVWDSSFLGNTHIAHQVASGTGKAYLCDNLNSRSIFLNCYAEDGTGASKFLAPAIVIGGFAGENITGDTTALVIADGGIVQTQLIFKDGVGDRMYMGVNLDANSLIELSPSGGLSYRLRYGRMGSFAVAGWWSWNFAELDGGDALAFSDNTAAQPYSRVWTPNGIYIGTGAGGFTTPGLYLNNGTTVPSSGTYSQGDTILNLAATRGSLLGWRNVSAGSPGTFEVVYGQAITPQAKTTNFSIVDDGLYTNTGASGEVDFTLPAATVGRFVMFSVEVAQILKAIASGSDVIRVGISASSAGGTMSSTDVGSTTTLRCTQTGFWTSFGPAGNWSLT